MSAPLSTLVHAARRLAASLQKETELARSGALGDLAAAAAAKLGALGQFTEACAARGRTPPATAQERAELHLLLAVADENALILEAVSSTLQDLATKVRAAAATAADPGTYSPSGSLSGQRARHVMAARVDASV